MNVNDFLHNFVTEYYSSISFSFSDIVDILIVTFILYRFFLIIKGTLAFQMFFGIFFLFVAFYFAQLYSLFTIRWLIQNFLAFWIIALLIIFQPELRRTLAEVGQRGFFKKRQMQDERMLEEILKATAAMAESNTGAIIVLERNTGLRNYREKGSILNADISSELLRAIFYPENPLHDGAVIINQNKIESAACFLPLSKNPQLGRAAGSRHRASIGITEESDALVIVVSEETGKTSLALDGKLQADLNIDSMRKILTKLYLQKQNKGIKRK
ncbi:diadenylate cyclase CdaA [candidate division CSSED10-310 bacterium]|uniref:Diadenylate cyclase n=1 Tax=candidate division CSSED10-310 bacterium TaxID=2855610 RepID=A0ABV6YRG2_UNCC1